MRCVGVGRGPAETGGTQSVLGMGRRWRVAAALATAALAACATDGTRLGARPAPEAIARAVVAGLDLYEAGEFVVAAERFREVARDAHALGSRESERRATIAECTAWLRARALDEFDVCTRRLAHLYRRTNRAEPGIGTLLALGAIAGDREPPPFRVASDVAPLIHAAAEGRRP